MQALFWITYKRALACVGSCSGWITESDSPWKYSSNSLVRRTYVLVTKFKSTVLSKFYWDGSGRSRGGVSDGYWQQSSMQWVQLNNQNGVVSALFWNILYLPVGGCITWPASFLGGGGRAGEVQWGMLYCWLSMQFISGNAHCSHPKDVGVLNRNLYCTWWPDFLPRWPHKTSVYLKCIQIQTVFFPLRQQ